MGIITSIRKIINRKELLDNEELQQQDLLNRKENQDRMLDISQRQGLLINSGLSEAEKQYILSDSIIISAIQMYLSDIVSICDKGSCIISSTNPYKDDKGTSAEKEEKVRYVFNQVFSNFLTESIVINILTNGEIFLDTKYNKGLNQFSVNETVYSRCTQLCFANGEVAKYAVSNASCNQESYGYSIQDVKNKLIDAEYMVRIYNPALSNSKICIELDDGEDDKELRDVANGNYIYILNSLSLLKQVYPDWLNSKLLELAVYRDRIAKSRFIQLIALELGRTSRVTSDQIYDSVKEYFDNRSVIDLEKQTYKSVIGNEPFTDYKVYTTRNGNGKLTFDNSLNGSNANVSSLADLVYNQNKVFGGIGIPKQYLAADDTGSALSNGSSLFFLDEKYQKRVITYIKRIATGWKNIIKNLLIQQEGKDFFYNWDFDLQFTIPENNEDVMRVKSAKIDYANSLLDLVDRLEQNKQYSIDAITDIVDEDIRKITDDIKE